jgi:trk system potassium uptake protein TrkH
MLLGATNFVTSYLLLKAKYRSIIRNSELRFQSFLLLVSIPLVFFCVTQSLYPTLDKALRVTVFELVSAATTTGFSTADYRNWKELGWIVMIVLMIIGGGTGSTAGGLKQYRVCIMYRGLIWEFKRRMLSEKAVTQPDVWHGEQQRFINDEDFRHVGLFIFLYMATFGGSYPGRCSSGNIVDANHRDATWSTGVLLGHHRYNDPCARCAFFHTVNSHGRGLANLFRLVKAVRP